MALNTWINNIQQPKKRALDTSMLSNLGNSLQNKMTQPVQTPWNMTTPFWGSTKYEWYHPWVDIANSIWTKIWAISSWVVTESVNGKTQNTTPTSDKSAFGNYVTVQDKNGNKVRYSHLNESYVPIGSQISKGQAIGSMWNSWNTYSPTGGNGSHLDLRVQNAAKKYLNPLKYAKKSL